MDIKDTFEKAKAEVSTWDDKAKDKVQELKDKTDLDEKAGAAWENAKGKVQETLDKTDLDEKAAAKFNELKDKAGETIESIKDKFEKKDEN